MIVSRALIVLAIVSASFAAGWAVNGWRLGADIADLKAEYAQAQANYSEFARRLETANNELVRNAEELALAERRAREAKAKVITKEVIKYVESPDSGKCDLPPDWVRIHDAAATGVPKVSYPSTESDGAYRGFTDIDAIEVISENYNICHASESKLKALQKWIREVEETQKALHDRSNPGNRD